jgi:hypothetical protein
VELSAPGRHAEVSASGSLWEVSESSEQTLLAGTIRLKRRDSGGKNTAKWLLTEDAQKSEIPTFLRTATLLKRDPKEPDETFQAIVEIKADIVFTFRLRSAIDRVCGTGDDRPTRQKLGHPNFFSITRQPRSSELDSNNGDEPVSLNRLVIDE